MITLVCALDTSGVGINNKIEWVSEYAPEQVPDNYTRYRASGFVCDIPPKPVMETSATPNADVKVDLESVKQSAIETIRDFRIHWRTELMSLEYAHGYWNYILFWAVGLSLHQVHYEGKSKIAESNFMLCQMDATVEPDYELITEDSGVRYVTQLVKGGQICDLTGQQRTTLIEYKCDIHAKVPVLASVTEWRTCSYIATVKSNWFCDHDAWALDNSLGSKLQTSCYLDPHTDLSDLIPVNHWDPTNYAFKPLTSGILMGEPAPDSGVNDYQKHILLLTKDFVSPDEESYQAFLISLVQGFKKQIKLGLVESPDKQAVQLSDSFIYNIPLYDQNGLIISDVTIDYDPQKESDVAYLAPPSEDRGELKGNWEMYQREIPT